MGRLTISDVDTTRSASQSSIPSSLSYKQYDAFKSTRSLGHPSSQLSRRHFSKESQGFSGASLKKLATPNPSSPVIPLGAGRPNTEFFPWESILIRNQSPSSVSSLLTNGNSKKDPFRHEGSIDLSSVLDYGHAAGSPQLLRYVTEHVELVHDPPYSDWGVCISSGSTSALEIALRILCDRGHAVLCEQLTYPGFLEAADLLGLVAMGIEMDNEGIKPESLSQTLQTWDGTKGPKPSVLYTIPSGQNPTGISQTRGRKAEIYRVAEQYDLVIIEDDPYYFLHLDSQDYFNSLVPSYVSIDTSGRVVRLDSVSKILAPGLRLGWITANDCMIDKFLSHFEVTTAFASGPSQLMLYKLLDESWGHRGFFDWLKNLSARYRRRRDIAAKACETYIPTELCTWTVPSHGIFLWMHVDPTKHAAFDASQSPSAAPNKALHTSIEEEILAVSYTKGVQVTSGSMFEVSGPLDGKIGFRLSFVTADELALANGVKIFAEAIRSSFCSKSASKM